MRLGRTIAIVLGAAFVPALAQAQDTPYDQTQPQAQPAQPAPTSQTTVNTTAPAQPPPVVIVNPPPEPQPQPTVMPANPEGEYEYDSWNAPVFTTGALVFAGSYGASAIVAASSDHPGADRLYVPVVGPWLALNDWGNCPITASRCDQTTTDKVLLIGDGVFQAAGIITMLDGILQPSYHRTTVRTADKSIHVSPSHNGVTVFGRF